MNTIEKKVAKVSDLAEGEMRRCQVDDVEIVLIHTGGRFYALGGQCPHYGAPLAEGTLEHDRIVCPWHASTFHVPTGDLIEPPSLDSLPQFEVRIDGDDVVVCVPEDAAHRRARPAFVHRLGEDQRLFAVVGAGAAGAAAVEAVRQVGFKGRVVMISHEDRLPYDRPRCSKDYLAGDATDRQMPLRSEEFYRQYGIERLHQRVVELDVPRRSITFETGGTLTADAILVATGGIPRRLDVPGADLAGVMTLRSWTDSTRIREAAQKAVSAVVVGSGFIGMEVAASLARHDVAVTVVSPESAPMGNQFGEEVGRIIRQLHEAGGTHFRLGHKVSRLLGEGHVSAVELDDGTRIEAQLVVVGLGVRPATDFLRGVALNDDGSVDVSQRLQLAENVYAAGDIARYPDPFGKQRIRIEHWRLAQQHGRTAGQQMVRWSKPFQGVPFFWTRQFGVSFGYAGHAAHWDSVIMTGNPSRRDFTAFYAADNRLLAALGTQEHQLAAFMQRMRTGQLLSADAIRRDPSANLTLELAASTK